MLYAAGHVRIGMHSMWYNKHAIYITVHSKQQKYPREHIASLVYILLFSSYRESALLSILAS